jgi:hypothetical protein
MDTADSSTSSGTERCPVCGQLNDCAMNAGQEVESCWCFSASIPAEALERIPEESRGLSCLCPRCAAGLAPESREGTA